MAATDTSPSAPVSDEPLSYRVVSAIAEAKGQAPSDLEPIYGSVDLESLDSLYANSSVDFRLEFTVQDFDVEIRDGNVRVEPADA